MTRIRHKRLPANTFYMLLNLTNKHVHAQLVDRGAGRVLTAAHTTESVSPLYKDHVIVILFALYFILFISSTYA